MKTFKTDLNKENSINPRLEQLGYKGVNVPLRVGFDRITISLSVKYIDWVTLYNKTQSEKDLRYKSVSVCETVKGEQALSISNGLNPLPWVSDIRVTINSSTLTICKSNLPGRKDICNFDICIKPIQGHECLGNVSNNSCKEEQNYVKELMQAMAKEYGIYFYEEYSVLRNVEINVTMKINGKEGGLVGLAETLAPAFLELEGFTLADYAVPEEKWVSNRDYSFVSCVPGLKITSINAISPTRKIKFYDKSHETMDSYNEKGKNKKQIISMDNLCRLEYVISKKEEISVYFRGKTNLFEMTQEDLNYAFRKLTEVLLKQPLNKYYRGFDNMFEEYFEKINIHDREWRDDFVIYLGKAIEKSNIGIHNITEEDLRHYVSLINAPSVKTHGARIALSIKKKIEKWGEGSFKVTKGEKEYIPLINWLCNIDGEEEQYIYYLHQ